MSRTVNIHEAKTNLSQLLRRVAMGEEVVIARSGRPVARLTRYDSVDEPRVEGRDAGLLTVPDDFTEPLPVDTLESFYA
ncbi:MAG: type II toxin-antitoxin system Phd/YefM family antitoxin [Spirochaetaceae bacterium]|nr:MAG: type II toxin-antitoxin system Phd/YefM family antitoxin [Spirochaetaceae bacterium]